MKKPHRYAASLFMTTIYLLIVISPIAPLAMNSKAITHAITGECVEDCNICGCSSEARANLTCCCAKKKQMQARFAKPSKGDFCALKTTVATSEPAKKGCCAVSQPVQSVAVKNDCCARSKQHQHDEVVSIAKNNEEQSETGTTVLKCGCPCGKGKQFALTGFGSNELIPVKFKKRIEVPYISTLFAAPTYRMASRHGEPPDPPPKIPANS